MRLSRISVSNFRNRVAVGIPLGGGAMTVGENLRALRLYLDGGAQRSLSSASLGALKVQYIAITQSHLGIVEAGETSC